MSKTYIFTNNKQWDDFIQKCLKELNKKNVDLHISTDKYVIYPDTKEKCNGYFCEEGGVTSFGVATGNPINEWTEVFVHEYCHFEQWKEQIKLWQNDCDEDMWEWMENKKEFSKKRIKEFVSITRDLEWDCEKRAIKKIKKFKLPVDTKMYAKKALAYICFYDYIMKHRKWYKTGSEPYRNKTILDFMPDDINNKPDLTPELEKLFTDIT